MDRAKKIQRQISRYGTGTFEEYLFSKATKGCHVRAALEIQAGGANRASEIFTQVISELKLLGDFSRTVCIVFYVSASAKKPYLMGEARILEGEIQNHLNPELERVRIYQSNNRLKYKLSAGLLLWEKSL